MKAMRERLKAARNQLGLTQQQMADRLGMCSRNYKYIESGKTDGKVKLWDELEAITGVDQRSLREISANRLGQEDNQ